MDKTRQDPVSGDELSLRELIEVVWRGKWLIMCVTAAATLAAGALAWVAPKQYEAVILVSPVSSTLGSSQLGGLTALASQFGGLASLAGLAGGDLKSSESVATLESRVLTEKYIQTNNLLPILYEGQWDPHEKTWKTAAPDEMPTLWKASELFAGIRSVTTDARTGLVRLTITWSDPTLAATWANDLVKLTNQHLQQQAIEEAERNIGYLNDEAMKTDLVGVRQVIYGLLEREINEGMLARGSEEYALKVLDPAVPPERPSSPRPLLWTVGGFLGGFFLSLLAVLLRLAWQRI
jgi:uncharacterized protein involved in exopolysaccharide biosynthesis